MHCGCTALPQHWMSRVLLIYFSLLIFLKSVGFFFPLCKHLLNVRLGTSTEWHHKNTQMSHRPWICVSAHLSGHPYFCFLSGRLVLPVSSWSGSSPTASMLDWRPWKSSPSCRQTRPLPQSSSTWRASGRLHVWWKAAPSKWTDCTSWAQFFSMCFIL